jgi:hypothetical protein
MSSQAYVGLTKRTFQQALLQLLEQDYGLLGSRRILELLAQDVQQLIEQFYPAPKRLRSGWLVFTGTKASGPKAHPGQAAGEHELVTLAWPVLLPEDLAQLAHQPDTVEQRRDWFRQRLIRLVEYGWQHPDGPVLLTQADLGAMVGLPPRQISQLLQEARQLTGKALLTKGYYFDQGMRPTHKAQIIALYEQGRDEAAVARHSGHTASSVGRYIRDYERVKLLLSRATPVEQIPHLVGLQPSVVEAYVKLVDQYHPYLVSIAKTPSSI